MASKEAVRLGLMPPLSGMVSMYGQEIRRAAEIACQEINESGGVLGRPLQLIIEDDGSLPESAVRAAERLLEDHRCIALVGNLLSNSRIAVAYRIAEPRRIPYLNFSFYEGSILSRYFFHFAALPNQQIDRMIPFMKDRRGPRMYFCGNSYEWPRGSIDAAKRALEECGGDIAGEEYLPLGITPEDIEALSLRIVRSGSDVLVPYFAGNDQLSFLTRFNPHRRRCDIAVVMGHYDEAMASRLAPEVREGLRSCNTYFMSVETPENRALLRKLAAWPGVDGIWPRGNGIVTNFGEGTYLCVRAFALATNQAGTLDPEAIISALEEVRFRGPQGPVRMDRATHHASVNSFLSVCQADGTFRIVEKFGAIDPVIPVRYRHLQIARNPSPEEDIRLKARIVEQMTEAVYLVNAADGTIAYVNPALERMFGFERSDLIGKPMSLLTTGIAETDPLEKERVSEINRLLYRKGTWEGEVLNMRKDGSRFWSMVSMSAFTHAQLGEVWLAIQRDISDRKQQEEKLRAAAEELAKSNADLEQFAYIASHDLKEPLRMVRNYTDLLSIRYMGKLDARADKYIGYVTEGVSRMYQLVNDLFAYASAGQAGVKRKRIDAATVARSAVSNLSMRVKESGARITIDPLPEVSANASQLLQVFQNLVDNAIKFRRKDEPPRIHISARRSFEAPHDWVFSVQDNGIGIDPRYSDRVFIMFRRLHERSKYPGTGIGLAICKRIVEKHGGSIRFDSSPGKGTTFYFTLPGAQTRDEDASKAA